MTAFWGFSPKKVSILFNTLSIELLALLESQQWRRLVSVSVKEAKAER
jgi:hypothetical protein